jgi:hypothetical protein
LTRFLRARGAVLRATDVDDRVLYGLPTIRPEYEIAKSMLSQQSVN